jgi:hypothetical protein
VLRVPAGKELVTTAGADAGRFTVTLYTVASDWALLSVTLTVKVLVPSLAAVPEITPVLAASVRPAGSVPVLTAQE